MPNRCLARACAALTALIALSAPDRAPVAQTATAARTALEFPAALAAAESMPRLHSLLVSHHGRLVVERYFNGSSPNRIANVKSVSKSLISALVGIAIDTGHIDSVDQPITEFFPERIGEDPARDEITIGHLLSMQAGLETTSNRNFGAWVQSSDWVGFALRQPMQDRPGGRMIYSTGNTHLLSAILTRATGRSTLEFAREHLSEPLGFRLSDWPTDPDGIYRGGNDMEMTPRQMIAFGELYLNEGNIGTRRVLAPQWIEASLTPRIESPREDGRYYGYGWWIRDMAGFRTPYAWGYGGQFIVLVPDLDLVIATTSSSYPGDGRRGHTRRMYELIEDLIVAAAAAALPPTRR